jgi:hypothetical protein
MFFIVQYVLVIREAVQARVSLELMISLETHVGTFPPRYLSQQRGVIFLLSKIQESYPSLAYLSLQYHPPLDP